MKNSKWMMALAGLSLTTAVFATEVKSTTKVTTKHTTSASDAAMQKEAKVTMAQARAIALAQTPGTITDGELEREHGQLIYSFDIKTTRPGVTEVQVNAITGKIVSTTHETPAKEVAEKKKEAAEKKPVAKH